MFKATINEQSFEIQQADEHYKVNGDILNWDLERIGPASYHLLYENISYNVEVLSIDSEKKTVVFKIDGKKLEVELKSKMDLLLEKLGMDNLASNKVNDIKAPMPGLILSIDVAEGDDVKKGDPVAILEAMKMENIIKSPGDGIVKAIKVKKGDGVEKGEILVLF